MNYRSSERKSILIFIRFSKTTLSPRDTINLIWIQILEKFFEFSSSLFICLDQKFIRLHRDNDFALRIDRVFDQPINILIDNFDRQFFITKRFENFGSIIDACLILHKNFVRELKRMANCTFNDISIIFDACYCDNLVCHSLIPFFAFL